MVVLQHYTRLGTVGDPSKSTWDCSFGLILHKLFTNFLSRYSPEAQIVSTYFLYKICGALHDIMLSRFSDQVVM